MSRVAKKPIPLPTGVKVAVDGQNVSVTGPKGALTHVLHADVSVAVNDGVMTTIPSSEAAGPRAQAGTARAVLSNIVEGVSKGYERKLEIVGVGYRAQAKGQILNLTLGFSHPVEFPVPEGITVETPSQTEFWSKASTSNWWVRWPQIFALTASRNPTRARALSTPTRRSSAKKPRRPER